MPPRTVEVPVPGEDVVLEGLLSTSSDPGAAKVAIFHPHPKLGGDLHNNVVSSLALALHHAGWTTLCVNTRGVGNSTGRSTWRGVDERQDVLAAVRYLVALDGGGDNTIATNSPQETAKRDSGRSTSPSRVYLIGYSFGAAVTCSVATELGLSGYVSVSLPAGLLSDWLLRVHWDRYLEQESRVRQSSAVPTLMVIGDCDMFTSQARWRAMLSEIKTPVRAVTESGADHFWIGRELRLANVVVPWLTEVDGASK